MESNGILSHEITMDPTKASVEIDESTRLESPVEPNLYAKFCEHLGRNIYHGMEAEILFNPTFGKWPFHKPGSDVMGGFKQEYDLSEIESLIANHDYHRNFPKKINADAALDAYTDGGAFGWMRYGSANQVILSPDVGPTGNQAQRIEINEVGPDNSAGLRQRTALPNHRTQRFECRVKARSKEATELNLSLSVVDKDGTIGETIASTPLSLDENWSTRTRMLGITSDTHTF
ncbi:hypothetical protein [Saliphagus infecundisoli]|uniref:Uncharacterized protein n=1 Tax=Saliphagus infecundisoli TaxID=1849069 RepID=A0ABD5QKX4_9EURY|nr:hypothetical protein [Saliphagus infecundisoli]